MTRRKLEIRRLRITKIRFFVSRKARDKNWILDGSRRIRDFLGKIEQERSGNLIGKYRFSGKNAPTGEKERVKDGALINGRMRNSTQRDER
jgi:hypothetical protein